MSGTIMRVYCVDGPHPGLQYVDAATGRVLFVGEATNGPAGVYRVAEDVRTDGVPTAYFTGKA
jgi:hypothetical protein